MKRLALCCAVIAIVTPHFAVAQNENIGKSLPSAPHGSQFLQVEADPELYENGDLTGDRIRQALSKDYKDRASFTGRGRHDSEIYKAVSPSVVIVVTPTGLGSGSYIGDGRILTNWHVIKGFKEVGLVFKPSVEGARPADNSLIPARVVKFDDRLDLALIQMSSPPATVRSVVFATEADIQVGADVHAIGHPTGEVWTYTKGIISQYRRDYEWRTQEGNHKASVIQTQTPINPGNSGGPLLTDDGKLVGVNSFKASGEALNFAVSVVDVERFLGAGAISPEKKAGMCRARLMYDGRDSEDLGRLVQYDTNCDGKPDYSIVTLDDLSRPVLAHLDTNHDGKTDITVEDRKRIGWTISFHDVDYDGKIDIVGYHDGKILPARFENYVVGANY